jgi:hypothetical protein
MVLIYSLILWVWALLASCSTHYNSRQYHIVWVTLQRPDVYPHGTYCWAYDEEKNPYYIFLGSQALPSDTPGARIRMVVER